MLWIMKTYVFWVLYFSSEAMETTTTSSSSFFPSITNCTRGQPEITMEGSNPVYQRFEIIPAQDFKYLQVSMKIESCYSRPVTRGNYFLSGENIHVNQTNGESLPLDVSYKNIAGKHGYHISIQAKEVSFSDDVDTTMTCGKCLGFKVKAVGANICTQVIFGHNEIKTNSGKVMQKIQNGEGKIRKGDYEIEPKIQNGGRGNKNGGFKIQQKLVLTGVGNKNEGLESQNQLLTGALANENGVLEAKTELLKGDARIKLLSARELVSSLHQLHLFINWGYLIFVSSFVTLSFLAFLAGLCIRKKDYRRLGNTELPEQPSFTA
ncbi:uncharacterized protein [Palaemon carinicauda]|uniref:uncharacterized protein n=1 Tax=Palaemon carinicauda TaxID=392227 RepID=UPI0035B6722B